MGLSPKDSWLIALLLISVAGYLAAARWSSRLADGRPIMMYSIGFSAAFVLLALVTGLVFVR